MNGAADSGLPDPVRASDDDGGGSPAADPGSGWGSGFQLADNRVVNYVFPVEIVVVGALSDEDRRGIYQQVWADLGDAMAYQNA
jgi:hypothetical protein